LKNEELRSYIKGNYLEGIISGIEMIYLEKIKQKYKNEYIRDEGMGKKKRL
jgi:hypothetical protein